MTLPPFRNAAYADFSQPENREGMQRALAAVRRQLGREYQLFIGGERVVVGQTFLSRNPSAPAEVVGERDFRANGKGRGENGSGQERREGAHSRPWRRAASRRTR